MMVVRSSSAKGFSGVRGDSALPTTIRRWSFSLRASLTTSRWPK